MDILPTNAQCLPPNTPLPNKQLTIKLGVDPTASALHLGHAVVFACARRLQDAGHHVVLLIGDFTASLGDPTGRNAARPVLDFAQIDTNAATYVEQALRFLDPARTSIERNRQWFGAMSAQQLLGLSQHMTVARMLERDDFAKRLQNHQALGLHETLYPLLQGFDSVQLKADVEIGGQDQLFNMMVGRQLQEKYEQPPQHVITVPLLLGLDGVHKMSKSLGNHIGIAENAVSQINKLMTLNDDLIPHYGDLLTNTTHAQWVQRLAQEHPRAVKADLAQQIVARCHNAQDAQTAFAAWEHAVRSHQAHTDTPTHHASGPIAHVLKDSGLCMSLTVSKQKIKEGAVRFNGKKVDNDFVVSEEGLLSVGKRHFVRITPMPKPKL